MFDINKLPNANSIAPAGVVTQVAPTQVQKLKKLKLKKII